MWGYQDVLGQQKYTRGIEKIKKDFELCQVFMYNSVSQNVWIFLLFIFITRRIDTFWSQGSDEFLSGGTGTFWARKITQERSEKFMIGKIFQSYQVFIHILFSQNVPIPPSHILPMLTKSIFPLSLTFTTLQLYQ